MPDYRSSAASRNSPMASPPTVPINNVQQSPEPKPVLTDILNSDTDTDTEAESMLDTDTEAQSDSDTEKHTDNTAFTCLADTDKHSTILNADTCRDEESDRSTDTQPRTEGDLHIHSVL